MARTTSIHNPCSPPDVLRILELVPASLNLMLWGPPGVGKTALMEKSALRRGLGFLKLPLASMDTSDLLGLPDHSGGVTTFAPPAELYVLTRVAEGERRERLEQDKAAGRVPDEAEFEPTPVLLCLDERPQASVQLAHALAALQLDRTIGLGGLAVKLLRRAIALNPVRRAAYLRQAPSRIKAQLTREDLFPLLQDRSADVRAEAYRALGSMDRAEVPV